MLSVVPCDRCCFGDEGGEENWSRPEKIHAFLPFRNCIRWVLNGDDLLYVYLQSSRLNNFTKNVTKISKKKNTIRVTNIKRPISRMTEKGNFEFSGWGFLKIRTQEKVEKVDQSPIFAAFNIHRVPIIHNRRTDYRMLYVHLHGTWSTGF